MRNEVKLAAFYEEGRVVDKDMTKATDWYKKAAWAGNEDAKKWLDAHGLK